MPPTLSEDEIDDLLYFARTGDLEEFNALSRSVCKRESLTVVGLLEAARDEMSGNGVLHMAAANGHDGEYYLVSYSFKMRRNTMGLIWLTSQRFLQHAAKNFLTRHLKIPSCLQY